MTPQSAFMVCATLDSTRRAELEQLLTSMTSLPGQADPANALIPFGAFERLHFARIVILEDLAAGAEAPPPYLAFLGDCDGDGDAFLHELAERTPDGLRRVFGYCRDFQPGTNLLRWMQDHATPPATYYVNWVGRTVRQVREEAALRAALVAYLREHAAVLPQQPPREIRARLIAFVAAERQAGRLSLTQPTSTPPGWQLRNILHAAGVALALLALAPFLLLGLPFYLIRLRQLERSDAEITPRPAAAHLAALGAIEDHDVSNQFSAYGSIKPGRFRYWTLVFLLWVVNATTRHIYTRGRLARVPSIHFARWVFLEGGRRLFFASNYDGSLDSYMDDFINKVAWGLNLVFSNGVGYPKTNFLILGGAKDEQKFKYYIRRRQLVTSVWYKAYPGLTAYDLARNSAIRAAIEASAMTEAETRRFLQMV
ncbi:hypothetical protein [Limobrevibacterium gyesilva]|uniref:Uncharacterized protein n=1 Tax=Limobrevibacterium gyesilva TaxID=2991712 RepID=A0AA41YNF0_9PROT|nr:hypothetical protein [Limobrevibacterium gyesilva]MCW3475288.1 hypothetical protein [Limobrevibacterium gyesilva]